MKSVESGMQHLVFGAGLIGGYVGAALAHQGQSVGLIARDRIVQRWQDGLRLSDYRGNKSMALKPLLFGEDWRNHASPCDVLWLTVKCTGVQDAAEEMAPLIAPHTLILCCQNGLSADAIVKRIYPNNRVLRVMVPFNVVEERPGYLHRGSEGALNIEKPVDAEDIARLVKQLNNKLLPVKTCKDMTALQWAKLQLNLGNAVNALANVPVHYMLRQRGYRMVLAALMAELLSVAQHKSLSLPRLTALPPTWLPGLLRQPDWLFKLLANSMLAIDPKVRTSMWWDLHLQRPTEIAFLNGALVDEAVALGLPCPVNRAIVRLIGDVEAGRSQWGLTPSQLQSAVGLL
ncbi:2-dehydropantoate 2-reductase [Aliiglaciecola sp. CAU 1673]|uniref:2-dehydropantoate 2-reductase n=1 Tax=Aliiglaciecola sp. CAU 1673 TaxID=3032595 RepID=UPI0023DAC231|nr:2-dehydropantoate 2-reductase [Aliiglaciecola sp. CAU 1673]MDF2177246.1 2-dehydropantoate 2-reductase [Aliiglaciecola sp. CAU 1673]